MKIYTGKGDKGETSLFSGERVPKDHARIEAFGDLDELNSILGALTASLPDEPCTEIEALNDIQSDLLHLGSWLAASPGSEQASRLQPLAEERIRFLEDAIDRLQRMLLDGATFNWPSPGYITRPVGADHEDTAAN